MILGPVAKKVLGLNTRSTGRVHTSLGFARKLQGASGKPALWRKFSLGEGDFLSSRAVFSVQADTGG